MALETIVVHMAIKVQVSRYRKGSGNELCSAHLDHWGKVLAADDSRIGGYHSGLPV